MASADAIYGLCTPVRETGRTTVDGLIVRISPCLDQVNMSHPITFDWKEGGMHDLGFGAEGVAAVEPLRVTRNAEGQVEGVKYDRLSVAFVNAFKEQQARIAAQQREVRTL